MLTFESDYTEGCCPEIMDLLVKTNMEQVSGYGHDKFCDSAKEKIAAAIGCPDAQIQFLVGGTQTNQIVIDSMLQSFQGVISCASGHVNCHEAGAIEYTGHKVLAIPQHNGKIDAKEMEDYIETFYHDEAREHMIFPGMVYISHPTEYGTLYSKQELTDVSNVCKKYNLPLFLDGARLGYALGSSDTDVTIKDIAELTDVFYIGGTKVGALCGEAVVFTKKNMPCHFENFVKKHGALLAKGRLLGLQFDALFTDDLYLKLGRNACKMADILKVELTKKGYKFLMPSPTNQQFVIMENKQLETLKTKVGYSFWEKYDDTHTVIRLATSWATTKENLDTLLSYL